MRPFVKLIRCQNRQAEDQRFAEKESCDQGGFHRQREERDCHERRGKDTVRAVRLDEIVFGNRLWVQMMLAERSDESRAQERRRFRAIAIGEPVHNSGHQIRKYVSRHNGRSKYGPGSRSVKCGSNLPGQSSS